VNNKGVPCPACGFYTIGESEFGSFNICNICGWEDDCVQLANPACQGGANGESLIEAQQTAVTEYPLDVTDAEGYTRDKNWRPLNIAEVKRAEAEKAEKYWKNHCISKYEDAYWVNKFA
jgi:hypothetical protein